MKTLKTIKKLSGKINVLTGLHVGGSVETMEIGGVDNPIIRNPANGEPYIPGSSIKGKMRSLMEWHIEGKITANGDTHNCKESDCPICRVFGSSADRSNMTGPTRLIVRDAFLNPQSRERFKEGDEITEIKYENSINRISAFPVPRPLERVVPGVMFDLDISYRVFDMGDGGRADEEYFEKVVLEALRLVQDDSLGGSGSRGCGKIEFIDLQDETGKKLQLNQREVPV